MLSKQKFLIYIALLFLITTYDVIIPLIFSLLESKIQNYFVYYNFSGQDFLNFSILSLFLPKVLAISLAFSVPQKTNGLNPYSYRLIRNVNQALLYLCSIIIILLTIRVIFEIFKHGYSFDHVKNLRSGYLIKHLYILSALIADIYLIQGDRKFKMIRLSDLVFVFHQLLVLDKLMLGIFVFVKLGTLLFCLSGKSFALIKPGMTTLFVNIKNNAKNLKNAFLIVLFLIFAYIGNRVARGDEGIFFFQVLCGYIVAPIVYLYSYSKFGQSTEIITNFISHALYDNSVTRLFLSFTEHVPNHDAFAKTFELAGLLDLNISFNVFRFDSFLLELANSLSIPFEVLVFGFYNALGLVIFKGMASSSIVNRAAAVLGIVFVLFGFTDTSFDFYFSILIVMFVYKILECVISMVAQLRNHRELHAQKRMKR